ncbi:MAG: hypothetical protein U0031_06075 [Thermomicrobiales bacterium]
MTETAMSSLRQQLARALDRKTSLRLLGIATVAAAVQQIPDAEAKKGSGGNALCYRQRDPCLLFIQTRCQQRRLAANLKIAAPVDTVEECVAALTKCCDKLSRCEFGDALECMVPKPGGPQK